MKKVVWFLIREDDVVMYDGNRTIIKQTGFTPPLLEAITLANEYENKGFTQTYYDFVKGGNILIVLQGQERTNEPPIQQVKKVLGHKASARIPFFKRVLNFLKGE